MTWRPWRRSPEPPNPAVVFARARLPRKPAPRARPPRAPWAPDRSAWVRGQGGRLEPVLGGRAAVRQAAQVVRRALPKARRALDQVREYERGVGWFRDREALADDVLKDALAQSVPARSDETDGAYDERLTLVYQSLRARIDPLPKSAGQRSRVTRSVGTVETQPPQPSKEESVTETRSERSAVVSESLNPTPPWVRSEPPVAKQATIAHQFAKDESPPTRREIKIVNPGLYRTLRRKPTAREVAEAVRNLRAHA